jgi:hypothetical protein
MAQDGGSMFLKIAGKFEQAKVTSSLDDSMFRE